MVRPAAALQTAADLWAAAHSKLQLILRDFNWRLRQPHMQPATAMMLLC
jgi:hypothetical protein